MTCTGCAKLAAENTQLRAELNATQNDVLDLIHRLDQIQPGPVEPVPPLPAPGPGSDPTERVAEALRDADRRFHRMDPRYFDRLAQAAIDAHVKALQLTEETRREEVDTGRWGTEVRLVGAWVEGER